MTLGEFWKNVVSSKNIPTKQTIQCSVHFVVRTDSIIEMSSMKELKDFKNCT